MKLGLAMMTIVFGVAAMSAIATACSFHAANSSVQAQAGQQTNTTATTTTGKTTGG